MFFDNEFSVDGKVRLNCLSHAWGQLQTKSLKPIDKAVFKDGERVVGPQRK
jgi:hypothetical protein